VEIAPGLYQWAKSCTGAGCDFFAAGSNVIYSIDGRAAGALNATSSASPIAAGVAAVVLAGDAHFGGMHRDRRRWRYALERVTERCIPQVLTGNAESVPVGARFGMIYA